MEKLECPTSHKCATLKPQIISGTLINVQFKRINEYFFPDYHTGDTNIHVSSFNGNVEIVEFLFCFAFLHHSAKQQSIVL